jgi:DNA-binding GntR family transcriptional regulator
MRSSLAESEFNPQYPVSLEEQITEFLTNAIIEGRLIGGQRLIENELQRKFKVSRTPIRESFRVLEKMGLVLIIPRKGTFIRKIAPKDIEENFPIRAELEGLAARLAVPHFRPKDIEEMELLLMKMTEAAKQNDFKSYFKHHTKYHEFFINTSKNDTLIAILENLRRQAVWFRFSYLWHQENFEYAIRIHRKILDLIIKKDADRLGALVKRHIIIALERFLEFLAYKKGKRAISEISTKYGKGYIGKTE